MIKGKKKTQLVPAPQEKIDAAFFIDMLILIFGFVGPLVTAYYAHANQFLDEKSIWLLLLLVIALVNLALTPWLYFALFFISPMKATLGQKMFDLQTVKNDGSPLGIFQAIRINLLPFAKHKTHIIGTDKWVRALPLLTERDFIIIESDTKQTN